ncbi:MipA/OmpV family protein [Erwinia sp. E602]|uniref:MipA/OmpV family protein n=1 Tax=Erwinia sp. E602 TaxID=2675378 RepID=UPI001BA6F92D|nr:MipA/OmpV family protein [Erwinia sp. E602]
MKQLISMAVTTVAVISCPVIAAENVDSVITLGIGYSYSNKYSGSDESSSSAIPYFRMEKGIWFADSYSGLGLDLDWDNGVYFTQAIGYSLGRAAKGGEWRSGSRKLKGMGNIKFALVSSSTLGWQVNPWLAVEGNVTAPLSDGQGLNYRTGAKFSLWSGRQDTLVLSSNAHFGDARYNNLWYGVSHAQSQHTGYQRYHATSGLYSVDASLSWVHHYSDNWWSYAEFTYTRLTDNVNHSPIVFTKNGTDVGLGLLYSF